MHAVQHKDTGNLQSKEKLRVATTKPPNKYVPQIDREEDEHQVVQSVHFNRRRVYCVRLQLLVCRLRLGANWGEAITRTSGARGLRADPGLAVRMMTESSTPALEPAST